MDGYAVNFDDLMYEVALVRCQLRRHMSASSAQQQQQQQQRYGGATRVTKPRSAGNSPNFAQQRRRMAATGMNRNNYMGYRQDAFGSMVPVNYPQSSPSAQNLQPHNYLRTRASIEQFQTTAFASPLAERPFSWHPNTYGQQMQVSSAYQSPVAYRNSSTSLQSPPSFPPPSAFQSPASFTQSPYNQIATTSAGMPAFTTVAVNGMPTPLTQAEPRSDDMPSDSWLSLENCLPQQQSMPMVQATSCTSEFYASGSNVDYQSTYANTTSYLSPDNAFSPPAMQMAWSSTGVSSFTQAQAHTAPPTPDFLPIQKPADPMVEVEEIQEEDEPQLPALLEPDDGGEQLVGMGLYDDTPDTSEDDEAGGFSFLMGSPPKPGRGKGLKLEEAWEPKEMDEDDDDDEEDAEGEDDDDESEEDLTLPLAGEKIAEVKPELVERTFFVDSDAAEKEPLSTFVW